ncbi:DIT1 [Candida pseudojiufengensis]|uniref:DIT1 n=1 Tax=Candida pseudojiufengensis TaxID=497109 RepID=UPI0022253132|nr:DIT1 [Candida pseudojiufengensis]KAI5962374.1 DIT1 [Candida pseudojiufengensis]
MESVSTLSLNTQTNSSTSTIDFSKPIYENICMLYSRNQDQILSLRYFNNCNLDLTDAILNAKFINHHNFKQATISDDFHIWELDTQDSIKQGIVTLQILPNEFDYWFLKLLISDSKIYYPTVNDFSNLTTTITEIFASKLKHTVENDKWDVIGKFKFQENVEFFTQRGVPIEAVLPAFPCKSSNYEKVSGDLPDKGEELALKRLIYFAEEVEKIYPPGIIIWIISDGHVFSDCIAVDDLKVNQYSIALKQIYKRIQKSTTTLKFHSLPEIFKNIHEISVNIDLQHFLDTKIDYESEICRKIMMLSCDTDNGKLKQDINTPNHPRLSLFRGFSKFMTEDLQFHPKVKLMTRKKFKKIVSQVAFEMIKRNDAYSNLVELMFPFHLRFSIHAHNNSGPKYGISLLSQNGIDEILPINNLKDHKLPPTTTDLLHIPTPWHNSIVLDGIQLIYTTFIKQHHQNHQIMSPTPLQIKVNALKRLIKEEQLYQQEVKDQETYVNQMKSQNADEYEIKKQIQVLEESQRMVPQVNEKIKELKQSLEEFINNYNGDEDLSIAKNLLK